MNVSCSTVDDHAKPSSNTKRQRLRYGDKVIPYRVIFLPKPVSKIAIHVHSNGTVQVDAPDHSPLVDIKQAVQKRARWILKHLDTIEEQQRHILTREYVSGETHFYLGKRYPLKVYRRKDDSVKLLAGRLVIHCQQKTPEYIQPLLMQWYRTRCADVFTRRFMAIADTLTWVDPIAIQWKLLLMRKQWGSCSPKGIIALNPHLVKAPRDCIDYVLLHELAHMREHNHSKRFYQLLDRHMPDWRARKAKLDSLAGLLVNE